MGWVRVLLLGLGALVVTWAVLVVLARRLPPGLMKDLAGILLLDRLLGEGRRERYG